MPHPRRSLLAAAAYLLAILLCTGALGAEEDWQIRQRAMADAHDAIQDGDADRLAAAVAPITLTDHELRQLCGTSHGKDCVACLRVLVGDELERCGNLKHMAQNAVRYDAPRVAQLLIDHGVDLDELADEAIAKRDRAVARRLLAARDLAGDGVQDLDAPGTDGETSLTRILQRSGRRVFEDALLLLVAGADPDAPGADGRAPLALAVDRGRPDLVWALRAHDASTAPEDAAARAEALWDAYRFEPAVFLGRDDAPARIDLAVPQGLRLAQRAWTDPPSTRLHGRCCFGFEITIFVYPHASRLRSAAARLWPALGPPAREHKPVAAFTPPLWAGLTLTGVREPADVARLRGWRGCHAVDVEIRAPESLLPEAEALAKRLFGTLETASCPIHRDDVGILAALAAALCAAAFGLWRRSR